jgi:type I restriction enzyme, S subunit
MIFMQQTQSQTKNTPTLRFPKFREEWEEKSIGELGKLVGGGTPSKDVPKYWQGDIPWISSSDISEDSIWDVSYERYITKEAINNSATKLISANNILVISRVGVGKLAINDRDVCTSQDFTNIISKAVNIVFLAFLLKGKKTELLSFNQGTSIKGFTRDDLFSLHVAFPEDREQQKIADFLTAVDEKIAALQKKVNLLKKYKKGIMRQIFTQKIRFKDENGNDYPNWEEKKFGEVYEFLRTNSLSRDMLQDFGEIKNIHYGDIHMRLSTNFDSAKESISYLSSKIDSDYCQPGDLIIADASEDRIDIGKSIEVIKTNGDKIVAGLHTFLARPKIRISGGFSGYFMQSKQMRKQLWRIATGASVLGISKTELAKQSTTLPCEEEQRQIADFLSSIDKIIQLEERKLEQAKKFKKSLLQQMFI